MFAKAAFGHAEVLGQDVLGDVGKPVGQQEGFILVEVAVIEDEQELGSLSLMCLDRMGDAGREVPEIALTHIVLEGMTILVDGGDPHPALEHESPLGRLVPVQFPDRAGLESHVDAGKLGGDGHFADRRLPRPPACLQFVVAVGKGPSQVRHRAVIRLRRRQPVRALGLT